MRLWPRYALVLVGSFLAFSAVGCGSADQAQMQGTWVVIAAEVNGVNAPQAINETLIFDGDQLTIRESDLEMKLNGAKSAADKRRERKGTFQLDPAREPREIDLWLKDPDDKELKEARGFGIYKFEDDTLHLCIASAEALRPLKFETKPNERTWHFVAKRRPEKK
jgi:uncharacterized protein (TIGR03067 family)